VCGREARQLPFRFAEIDASHAKAARAATCRVLAAPKAMRHDPVLVPLHSEVREGWQSIAQQAEMWIASSRSLSSGRAQAGRTRWLLAMTTYGYSNNNESKCT
jgi:hypothetical protein